MKSIFELDEFKAYRAQWRTRSNELMRRRGYYDGSVYGELRKQLGWLAPRLYKGIKPLYLPLSRAVDVDAGIVPGDWAWPDPDSAEDITEAQIDAWALARRQVFDWSSWQIDGVLFVHYGAVNGVSVLRVADVREMAQVQIAPMDPATVMLVPSSQYDSTPSLAFYVEERTDADGKPYEYAEVITPQDVRIFVDAMPAAIDGRDAEYRNELGFVPFVECQHVNDGSSFGASTYQRAIPLLDEVNELASYLADIVKKHAEPQWAVFGAQPSELEHSGDNVWFIPGQGDAKILVPNIDVDGVLEFIREIRDQVFGAMPELAFDELRSKDQIATATLELQLMELVLKIKRVRPNYDQALIDALRMAGRAAASMGIADVAALFDENLAFDENRAVLPADPMDAINLEMAEIELEAQRNMVSGDGMTALVSDA